MWTTAAMGTSLAVLPCFSPQVSAFPVSVYLIISLHLHAFLTSLFLCLLGLPQGTRGPAVGDQPSDAP